MLLVLPLWLLFSLSARESVSPDYGMVEQSNVYGVVPPAACACIIVIVVGHISFPAWHIIQLSMGPSIDTEQRALNLIRGLSREDFEDPKLTFHPDGRISP